jgi:aspartate aminotransferase
MVTRNNDVIQTALKFAQARLSPPTFGQIASEAALDTPNSYFERVVDEYVSRRDCLVHGLNTIEGVFCPMPKGAFYAMARLPIQDSDHFCQWLLEEFRFKNATVMLAPATGFYSSPGAGKDEVRIGYVLKKEDLEQCVEILREALKIYPNKK